MKNIELPDTIKLCSFQHLNWDRKDWKVYHIPTGKIGKVLFNGTGRQTMVDGIGAVDREDLMHVKPEGSL